jgi:hypothetical protein
MSVVEVFALSSPPAFELSILFFAMSVLKDHKKDKLGRQSLENMVTL